MHSALFLLIYNFVLLFARSTFYQVVRVCLNVKHNTAVTDRITSIVCGFLFPTHLASCRVVVKILTHSPQLVNSQMEGNRGLTALHLAALHDHMKVAKVIVEQVRVSELFFFFSQL